MIELISIILHNCTKRVPPDASRDKLNKALGSVDMWPVWPEKIAKCLQKLPKNDFTRKMIDFDPFTKIA